MYLMLDMYCLWWFLWLFLFFILTELVHSCANDLIRVPCNTICHWNDLVWNSLFDLHPWTKYNIDLVRGELKTLIQKYVYQTLLHIHLMQRYYVYQNYVLYVHASYVTNVKALNKTSFLFSFFKIQNRHHIEEQCGSWSHVAYWVGDESLMYEASLVWLVCQALDRCHSLAVSI